MSSHASCYELSASRTPAGGSTRIDASYDQLAGILATALETRTPPIPSPSPLPYSGFSLNFPTNSYRVRVITDNVLDLMILEGQVGDTAWQVNGTLTENGGAIDTVGVNADGIFGGRMTGLAQLEFGGNVTIAIAALAGTVTGYDVTRFWQYKAATAYQGQAHFCDFEEVPEASALISTRAQEVLNQLNSGGNNALIGTLANGTTIKARNCVFTGLAPEGAVYIAPEDTGLNLDQIPTSVLNNTADKFRFHPSVFIRRGPYWNGVIRRAFDGVTVSAEDVGQPVQIVTVNNLITQSAWLIGVDGTMSVVFVQHGALDLRRPRDIWDQIWVPILNGSTSVRDAISVGSGANITDIGKLTRLPYLEYARCLPLPGTSVPQDDTSEQ